MLRKHSTTKDIYLSVIPPLYPGITSVHCHHTPHFLIWVLGIKLGTSRLHEPSPQPCRILLTADSCCLKSKAPASIWISHQPSLLLCCLFSHSCPALHYCLFLFSANAFLLSLDFLLCFLQLFEMETETLNCLVFVSELHCVAQGDLELEIFLPRPPKCLSYKQLFPHPTLDHWFKIIYSIRLVSRLALFCLLVLFFVLVFVLSSWHKPRWDPNWYHSSTRLAYGQACRLFSWLMIM